MNCLLWISGACASLLTTAASAATIRTSAAGGKPTVHVVASTNVTTKVVVQTIGPDGVRNTKMFNSGGAAQGNAETRRDAAPAVTWLGVTTESASDELRAQLSLDPGVGLTVFGVSPDGPAAKAGLQVHDILVRLGSQILMDPDQLKNLVRAKKAGDRVALTYLRKGKEATAELTLGEHAELAADAVHVINMGDFTVDVNQLLQQMPQIQRQSAGGGSAPEDVEAILKNLKIDDANVSRIVEEAVRKACKDVQAEPEK